VRTLAAASLLILAASCGGSPEPFKLTPEEEHLLRPVPEAPEKARRMVAHGDELFIQATAAYRRSNPEAGGSWATQNSMAVDLYTRARESYVAAQAESGLKVPPAILERSRECLTRVLELQKQRRAAMR